MKTSLNVVNVVALCFSMHVEIKTSVNMVTTVVLYVLACVLHGLACGT